MQNGYGHPYVETLRPLSSASPSNPPAGPVVWRFACKATHSTCEVVAKQWYAARKEAEALLGAEAGQLTWEIVGPAQTDGKVSA
jgi:hypothetical protein